jgi:hypothetical protein
MPQAYVKPYVKRHKNEAADAEAICEAVTRASMRFVATKRPEQQNGLMLHRQQAVVINAIRALLAEVWHCRAGWTKPLSSTQLGGMAPVFRLRLIEAQHRCHTDDRR